MTQCEVDAGAINGEHLWWCGMVAVYRRDVEHIRSHKRRVSTFLTPRQGADSFTYTQCHRPP